MDRVTVLVRATCNAPSEKGRRKGQRNPRRLNRLPPDTNESGTAGAVIFGGLLIEESFSRLFVRSVAQDPVFEGGGPPGLAAARMMGARRYVGRTSRSGWLCRFWSHWG